MYLVLGLVRTWYLLGTNPCSRIADQHVRPLYAHRTSTVHPLYTWPWPGHRAVPPQPPFAHHHPSLTRVVVCRPSTTGAPSSPHRRHAIAMQEPNRIRGFRLLSPFRSSTDKHATSNGDVLAGWAHRAALFASAVAPIDTVQPC